MRAYGLALSALLAVVIASVPLLAVTIHVPDGEPTIQAGINAASAGDTVLVACGTYYEHDIIMQTGITLMSETGLPECVTIDAEGAGRVLRCEYLDAPTLVAGLRVTHGAALTGGFPVDHGGALYIVDSALTLRDMDIVESEAVGGGGVFCDRGEVLMENVRFLSNSAERGGAIRFIWPSGSTGSPALQTCSFAGNMADVGGGAIYVSHGSIPRLTSCDFTQNTAADGGAIAVVETGGDGCGLRASDCTFVANEATDRGGGLYAEYSSVFLDLCAFQGNTALDGGGAWIYSADSETLRACRFIGNLASVNGGGLGCIHPQYYGDHVVTDCVFSANAAMVGGGMESKGAGHSLLIIEGCVFEDNVADEGGGIACTIYSYPTIIGCTLVGNEAPTGAAVLCHEGGSPLIEQTILAFSSQGAAVACTGYFSEATLVCCDVYGNAGGDWVGCIADQYGVDGNFSADPLFCDLTIGDLTLASNSPCMPGGNSCGELIGAHGEGCDESPVEVTSWGVIKSMYR